MAKYVLSAQKIFFGEKNITPDLSAVTIAYEADAKDTTTFGDDTHEFIGGLKATNFSASGFVDLSNSDLSLYTKVGLNDVPVTVTMDTSGAVPQPAYFFNALAGQYSPGESVGEVQKFNLSALSRGKLVRGQVLSDATITVDGNSVGYQFGAVSASQKLVVAFHVIAATDTLDVTIQSDNNSGFTTAASVGTLTQITGTGYQYVEFPGPITDDYFRFNFNVTGGSPSFTIAAAIGVI
jgi:hypothetical protein